ncbi:TonB-dependent receptor [Parvularcula dongshanensis]|uniref:Iron complex outermembrane receptor protein n=1 Tax=Parvularcula dongshanensis TaxID=1173995 RepID=A0A840I1R8_9PROT|nr:TonB-dependent receptor [Parvularcula dongshanensis]MBB4658192.1 iron complex outermembrane receptor protein [Parvularcula dongshanensis]
MGRAWTAAALAGGASFIALTSAFAQEAAPQEDVITVTARRVAEDPNRVPIPLTVVSGDVIERTGSYNLDRLKQLTPTLQFYSSNPRNSAINIRGLGAPFGLTNDGIEPGVGLYIDQVFYSRPAAASFDFIDVAQVEVLRGPQGTLFGKNTTAGAINVTTRPPSFTPEGQAEVSYGNLGYVQARASISGPLADETLAGRLSVSATRRDGTLTNVETGADVNELNNLGVRGQLLFEPSDALTLRLYADYNRQDTECCTQVAALIAPTQRSEERRFPAIAADLGYALPSLDPFDRLTDIDTQVRSDHELGGLSFQAEWKLGPGTLTSITGWRYWDWDPSSDRDFIGLPITTISANASKQHQWTQELRYAGTLTDSLSVVGGVFYFDQTIDSTAVQEQGAAAARFLLAPGEGVTPDLLDGYRQTTGVDYENRSAAAFGQLSWRITDRLSLEPGVRVNWDQKEASVEQTVSGGLQTDDPDLIALQRSVLAPQSYDADFDDVNVSGRVTATYALAGRTNLFATYARSFKSGGVNLSGVPANAEGEPALDAASIDPETVDHYEAGLKTALLSGRARLDLTAFRTDVEDYQTNVVNASVGVLRGYLAGAEAVRVQGVELGAGLDVGDGFSLYANGAYTDAEYRSFPDAPCPLELTGGPTACDVSGTKLPGVSRWAASGGAEYGRQARLLGARGRAYLGVDASYRSSFSSSASASDDLEVPAYGLVNLRAGFEADDGWELFAFLRNALDEDYYELLTAQPGNSGLVVGQLGDPRTYGATLRTRF